MSLFNTTDILLRTIDQVPLKDGLVFKNQKPGYEPLACCMWLACFQNCSSHRLHVWHVYCSGSQGSVVSNFNKKANGLLYSSVGGASCLNRKSVDWVEHVFFKLPPWIKHVFSLSLPLTKVYYNLMKVSVLQPNCFSQLNTRLYHRCAYVRLHNLYACLETGDSNYWPNLPNGKVKKLAPSKQACFEQTLNVVGQNI